jgi:hypothetical protein
VADREKISSSEYAIDGNLSRFPWIPRMSKNCVGGWVWNWISPVLRAATTVSGSVTGDDGDALELGNTSIIIVKTLEDKLGAYLMLGNAERPSAHRGDTVLLRESSASLLRHALSRRSIHFTKVS